MMHNSEIYFEIFFLSGRWGWAHLSLVFLHLLAEWPATGKPKVKTKWKEGARRGAICQKGETGNGQEKTLRKCANASQKQGMLSIH